MQHDFMNLKVIQQREYWQGSQTKKWKVSTQQNI